MVDRRPWQHEGKRMGLSVEHTSQHGVIQEEMIRG